MIQLLLRRAVAAALLVVGAGPAWAAGPGDPAPSVVGVVTDADGLPLPSAVVTIPSLHRSTTTGRDGSFAFRALRPGTYHLDATLIGYAPGHVEVQVPATGADVRVTIQLTSTPLAIEGINVTASPGNADPLNITQSTAELSGKELDRNVSSSVAQTLATQPGMSVRYAGPAASTPVIRGLSGERVLVLQNGQRAGDLSSTSADHALSIDPLAAGRVEVVRGPASLLYGNNALGGVVNVISGDIPSSVPGRVEGFLAGQGESVTPGGALTGALTLPVGRELAVTARGGFRDVDDVRVGGGGQLANTFYENRYGVGGVGYVGERVQGGVTAGTYRFDYGLPFRADGDEGGVRIDGFRHEASGRGDLLLGERGLVNVHVDGTAQWYGHDEIEDSGEVGTRFSLNTQTMGIIGRTRFGRVNGAVGVSGLFRQYAPEGEEALTPEARTRSGGVFVFQEFPVGGSDGAPRVQLGGRFDRYRIASADGAGEDAERFGAGVTRTFDAFSGSAGLSVPLGERLSASMSVAQSFRAPTVEELFSNGFHHAAGSFDVGDPDLRAETNRGAEVVLRAQNARVNAQLSGFVNRIDDYIYPRVVGETTVEHEDHTDVVPLTRSSQADARLHGLEGSVETVVSRRFVLGAMGDWVRGRFAEGGDLPFIPAARFGGSARFDDGRWSAGLEMRHALEQDRVSQPGCDREEESCLDVPTPAYTLVNASAGFRLIRGQLVHSLTLRADNVLDEEYRDAASRIKSFAPNPGRNLALVYRVLF